MGYDAIVVGAGCSGAVAARCLAQAGRRVLVVEKRPQIGGNVFDGPDENGVLVHWYGPHIFHTSSQRVWDYVQQFASWHPYAHRVLGRIDGRLVPIPFNLDSLEALYPAAEARAVEGKLRERFPGRRTASVLDLMGDPDAQVQKFGEFVFQKVFLHYTAKQWGTPVDQVDRSVINRVPVELGRDGRYFQDTYQAMPDGGFTPLFQRILDHPGIHLRLNCDARDLLRLESGKLYAEGAEFSGPVIYTGPVDELFGYAYGPLPYRSLDLRFQQLEQVQFQPAAVVNYPNEEDFTRITEFKQLTGQALPGRTTILREYPLAYDPLGERGNIPCYVISNPQNLALYGKYAALAAAYPGLRLCGRLAEYRYYNMDAAILRALELTQGLLAGQQERSCQ